MNVCVGASVNCGKGSRNGPLYDKAPVALKCHVGRPITALTRPLRKSGLAPGWSAKKSSNCTATPLTGPPPERYAIAMSPCASAATVGAMKETQRHSTGEWHAARTKALNECLCGCVLEVG